MENVILSYIPKINLDDTYQQEDQIARRIKESLSTVMAKFGYSIENALVTKIVPADAVVKAMNALSLMGTLPNSRVRLRTRDHVRPLSMV